MGKLGQAGETRSEEGEDGAEKQGGAGGSLLVKVETGNEDVWSRSDGRWPGSLGRRIMSKNNERRAQAGEVEPLQQILTPVKSLAIHSLRKMN